MASFSFEELAESAVRKNDLLPSRLTAKNLKFPNSLDDAAKLMIIMNSLSSFIVFFSFNSKRSSKKHPLISLGLKKSRAGLLNIIALICHCFFLTRVMQPTVASIGL